MAGHLGAVADAQEIAVLGRNSPPFLHSMFGTRVLSDVKLPIPQLPHAIGEQADWTICRAEPDQSAPQPDGHLVAELRCSAPCHRGRVAIRIHRGRGGAWFESDRAGTFHVRADGRRVDLYPGRSVDEKAVALMLIGQIASFVLYQLGGMALHASAVITSQGAVAFLGPKGQGKSTMAAGFLHRGAQLLTDDVLPVTCRADGVYGTPGLPLIKVWPNAAEHALRLTEELPDLMEHSDKKLFVLDDRYGFAQAPARLRAIYVLQRFDPVAESATECSLRPLSGRESVIGLLGQISWSEALEREELARLLPRYSRVAAQVPVRALRYPHGFEHQQEIYTRILSDLEAT
jgi:hypothetical protein